METTPTERVRESCMKVLPDFTHVHIVFDNLPAYAKTLPIEKIKKPKLDAKRHFLGRDEDTLAFFLILDAVNFGSGYFPYIKKRPGMSGYFTMATSLTEQFQKHGPLAPKDLKHLTALDCAKIFVQDPSNETAMELMEKFARSLNDLGVFIMEKYESSFAALVRAGDCSVENFIGILIRMPLYNDVSRYKGNDVCFYKRAQLTVADLHLAFGGKSHGRFDDIGRLTLFADNLVPHVLRLDGVLSYEANLLDRVLSGEPISAGSEEEVEIRAAAVCTVEFLKKELAAAGYRVTSSQLDYLLWNRGQLPEYKAIPRHRSRSVFY